MTTVTRVVTLVVSLACFAHAGAAQTVTSTTGAINGTVTDSTKSVLPGVTVTLSGPALMGTSVAVTDQNGLFRFSTVPIGEHKLTFELAGFGTIAREGIRVGIGFTATVNAEMNPGRGRGEHHRQRRDAGRRHPGDARSVTVLTAEQLAELPGSRDAWAVAAQTPGVAMSRMDVGGSNAWTQQGFQAYGVGGGERNEVEGIMVNEGSGQMYYTDFASFEEISVTAAGNTAEVGTPGAFSNFVSKSGSNTYHGTVYFDFENDAMEAHNIDDAQIAAGVRGSQFLDARDLNRLSLFRDFTADIGGYVKKDRLWWDFGYRNNVADLRFPTLVDDIQHTYGPVYSAKGTANVEHEPQAGGYYQHAGKVQPDYLGAIALRTGPRYHGHHARRHRMELGVSERHLEGRVQRHVVEPAVPDGPRRCHEIVLVPRLQEQRATHRGHQQQLRLRRRVRDRQRAVPPAGQRLGELLSRWTRRHAQFQVRHRDHARRPRPAVPRISAIPVNVSRCSATACRARCICIRRRRQFLSRLWAYTGYANDSWQVNKRLTLNLGVRSRSISAVPARRRIGPGGLTFAAVDEVLIWNNIGPRVGASFDVTGKGKTVVKANYGKYWLYPAGDFAGTVNPNPPTWRQIYTWSDLNSNGRWDSGEQVGSPTSVSGGTASTDLRSGHSKHLLASGAGIRRARSGAESRRPHRVRVERPASAHEGP